MVLYIARKANKIPRGARKDPQESFLEDPVRDQSDKSQDWYEIDTGKEEAGAVKGSPSGGSEGHVPTLERGLSKKAGGNLKSY